jgi:arylsulfatase A-like enzyme
MPRSLPKFLVPVLFLLSICCAPKPQDSRGGGKPNIVFILADDLGYGDLGCYGQQLIHTPALDSLAAGGMRFTQFYAGCPVCAPSRCSLLTGLTTGHAPIRGNKQVKGGQWPLPDTVATFPEMLQKAGYVTAAFGKWGLGTVGSTGAPLKCGFDHFFGYISQSLAHEYYPDHLWTDDHIVRLPNTPAHQVVYSADLIQRKALQFIDDHSGKPFFLFLPYTLPHAALQVPDDSIFERYKREFREQPVAVRPWNGKGLQPQPYPHAAYAAMVTRLDRYVGQIVRKLKADGLDRNTLVIFTSDNGPHHEGGNDPAFFNSNGPFRGIKRDMYEGGIREPMIAWWPGTIKAHSTSGYIGAFWDFMPTFCSLAGLPAPGRTDGLSMAATLRGAGRQRQHPYLYWELHEQGDGSQAVRMGKWKAVRLQVISDPARPIELYNLDTDTAETHDVAAQYPAIVRQMKAIMQQAHVENPVFPFHPTSQNNR